jgi:mannosyltransferase OCH1-like enzyme
MITKRIHQFFFKFPPDFRELESYPLFVESMDAYKKNSGWEYKLWSESDVDRVLETMPVFFDFYKKLRYDIQRVDAAKFIIGHIFGGVVSDLDVVPTVPLDDIVLSDNMLLDRDTFQKNVANDFFYVPVGGFEGLADSMMSNYAIVTSKAVYQVWKYRYVQQTTGPRFFTRYLRNRKLFHHVRVLSDRSFQDEAFSRYNLPLESPKLKITHMGTWKPQL